MKTTKIILPILVLTIVVSIVSCEKDPVFEDPDDTPEVIKNPDTVEVSNVTEIIDEIRLNQRYFAEDSTKNFRLEDDIIFGNDTFTFSLLNNLGMGRDSSGYRTSTIFENPKDFHQTVIYKLDEEFYQLIIISWDSQNNDRILDSIKNNNPKYSHLNPNYFPISSQSPFDSILNVDIVVRYNFGKVELDIENPLMNDFLTYPSSKYTGLPADTIPWSPQVFYNLCGSKYMSAMTLGNFAHYSMHIKKIDITDDMKSEIMEEAHGLIKMALNDNINWELLKQNSTFFKHSVVNGHRTRSIGGTGSYFLEDFSEINQIFEEYKATEFGILNEEYKPYNSLYPNLNL